MKPEAKAPEQMVKTEVRLPPTTMPSPMSTHLKGAKREREEEDEVSRQKTKDEVLRRHAGESPCAKEKAMKRQKKGNVVSTVSRPSLAKAIKKEQRRISTGASARRNAGGRSETESSITNSIHPCMPPQGCAQSPGWSSRLASWMGRAASAATPLACASRLGLDVMRRDAMQLASELRPAIEAITEAEKDTGKEVEAIPRARGVADLPGTFEEAHVGMEKGQRPSEMTVELEVERVRRVYQKLSALAAHADKLSEEIGANASRE